MNMLIDKAQLVMILVLLLMMLELLTLIGLGVIE